jgi:AcrR family transcriptional regulator
VAEARRTRANLLARGLAVASVDGLEGLTIGRLAAEAGMSKSGVLGQFGSKENLQLAVIETAATVFAREVTEPVLRHTPAGMPRLLALCAHWVSYLERGVFPGGCFFTAVATEFDDRAGPVRDAVAALNEMWQRGLRRHVLLAAQAGDLPPDTDPDQLVFELTGQVLALNHALRLTRDRTAPERARRAMSRLLGRPLPAHASCQTPQVNEQRRHPPTGSAGAHASGRLGQLTHGAGGGRPTGPAPPGGGVAGQQSRGDACVERRDQTGHLPVALVLNHGSAAGRSADGGCTQVCVGHLVRGPAGGRGGGAAAV